jgi:6,7-dimethyl-8-ribityllumazine synthase
MSGHDIDSTSENVLHDWPEGEAPEGGAASDGDEAPAWGAASAPDAQEPEPSPSGSATDVEVEEVSEVEVADETAEEVEEVEEAEPSAELADEELDESPMHVELSQEHAAGDLHIPDGYAVLEGVAEGGRRAVGVVVSRFNGSVTTQLLERALAELGEAGVRQEAITIMVVPGAFELPLAATALAKTRRFACIVALGCIIRGDTPHFDYVSSEAASGLQLAALETGVPVSFGVLTLDRVEQAEPRVHKGAEAVRSALEMADLFAHLRAAAAR